jgi:hypothetical protein
MENALSILAIGIFGAWQIASASDIIGLITLKGVPAAEKRTWPCGCMFP